MNKTLEFCTHYSQKGIIIVNATDHILRIEELDGTIQAARAFPREIVEPFYIDPDNYLIESDRFRAYEVDCEWHL